MKLSFAKMNPTENMTVLVTSPVSREEQGAVAEKLMGYGSLFAEQVGFLEEAVLPGARARLQMMGGEFCGNASMSLAALIAHEDGIADGGECIIPLEVSGADRIIHCRIRREGESYIGTVAMPLPQSIEEAELDAGVCLPVVRFPGIAHIIAVNGCMDAASARAVIPRWCSQLAAEALGILIADSKMQRIQPLVYVRATESSVWERGCGSGTAALGAYCAAQKGESAQLDVQQPGGVIRVNTNWNNGCVEKIEITGRVKIAAVGEAFIE